MAEADRSSDVVLNGQAQDADILWAEWEEYENRGVSRLFRSGQMLALILRKKYKTHIKETVACITYDDMIEAYEVKEENLDTTNKGKFIDDVVINAYTLIQNHLFMHTNRYCANTHIYSGYIVPRNLRTFQENHGKDSSDEKIYRYRNFFNYDVYIFPINDPTRTHWYVIAVRFDKRVIEIYDSLRLSSIDEYNVQINNIKNYLKACSGVKTPRARLVSRKGYEKLDFDAMKVVLVMTFDQQPDGNSCGAYVCRAVQQIMSGAEPVQANMEPKKLRAAVRDAILLHSAEIVITE